MSELLHHAVSARAAALPDAAAVVAAGQRLTYGELEAASNRLARLLLALGCGRGERVALLLPKQPLTIVAMLAALKAGAMYVPFDPAEPAARLQRLLQAADCRCVLVSARGAEALRVALAAAALPRAPAIGWLDLEECSNHGLEPAFRLQDLAAFEPTAPRATGAASDPAHILFTSGSTGEPKGVPITHASILAFLAWAGRHFGVGPGDRIAQHAPLRFDLSTFDVYGALRAGAELWLVPPNCNLQPGRLAQFLRESRITRWLAVPSTLGLMARFDVVARGDLPALRDLMFAGEVIPVPTLSYWMGRLPHARFTNLYGPTETTIASSYYTVPVCPRLDSAPIPIGRPCDGETLAILDARREPLPDGKVGDIYIGGCGLSPGYWRDPERSRSAFVTLRDARGWRQRWYRTGDRGWRDADGNFHFVGRADAQVKSRGYRIELGEIERALLALPLVQDAAVVAVPSTGFEGSLICCAFVPAREAEGSPMALRTALAAQLPAHMLPARWRRYRSLPVNANGKCDRRRLLEDFTQSEEGAAAAAAARKRDPVPRTAVRKRKRRSSR